MLLPEPHQPSGEHPLVRPPRNMFVQLSADRGLSQVYRAKRSDRLKILVWNRQAQILARRGVMLERSTLSFWMGYAAAEVAPVVARLREMMLASTRLFADETVVPALDPGRGRTKQGYFWAMARDDRPWGGSQPPAVVYSYAPGRGHTQRQHAAATRSRGAAGQGGGRRSARRAIGPIGCGNAAPG
jgi:hypothetical protein